MILLNDSGIVRRVSAVRGVHQQPLQINKGIEIDARRPHGLLGANNGIEHPVGHGNDHARWPHNAQKSPRYSLTYAPN